MNNSLVFKKWVTRRVLASDIERFWSKVKRHENGCWIFTGSPKARYVYFGIGPFEIGVHRFSYMLVHGVIDSSVVVLHACDNPRCVNPDHLSVGTQKENMQDMRQKGRGFVFPMYRGSEVGNAKLDERTVKSIRDEHQGYGDNVRLGRKYGVNPNTISRIVHRQIWRHI